MAIGISEIVDDSNSENKLISNSIIIIKRILTAKTSHTNCRNKQCTSHFPYFDVVEEYFAFILPYIFL